MKRQILFGLLLCLWPGFMAHAATLKEVSNVSIPREEVTTSRTLFLFPDFNSDNILQLGKIEQPNGFLESVCDAPSAALIQGSPTHRIYLPNDLSFGNSTHSWVTAHLGNGLHVHGDQQYLTAHIGGSGSGFTSGMAGTYNNHIIFWKHRRQR